jgi:hypothetical protein
MLTYLLFKKIGRSRIKIFTRSRSRLKMMRICNTALSICFEPNCTAQDMSNNFFSLNGSCIAKCQVNKWDKWVEGLSRWIGLDSFLICAQKYPREKCDLKWEKWRKNVSSREGLGLIQFKRFNWRVVSWRLCYSWIGIAPVQKVLHERNVSWSERRRGKMCLWDGSSLILFKWFNWRVVSWRLCKKNWNWFSSKCSPREKCELKWEKWRKDVSLRWIGTDSD